MLQEWGLWVRVLGVTGRRAAMGSTREVLGMPMDQEKLLGGAEG